MTTNDYTAAINAFVSSAAQYDRQIVSIYLGGSVARGDFTPGRSDIDVFVVLRARDGELERTLREHARRIEARYLDHVMRSNPEPFSVTFTSLDEIQGGSSFLGIGFEYHQFVTTAKRLYGEDIIPRIQPTDQERSWDIATFGLNMLQALAQAQDIEQAEPALAGFFFSPIFRAAALGLGGQGVFVGGKQETVEAFATTYPREDALTTKLQRAFALWQIWAERDLTAEETRELAQLCQNFVGGAYQLWCG